MAPMLAVEDAVEKVRGRLEALNKLAQASVAQALVRRFENV